MSKPQRHERQAAREQMIAALLAGQSWQVVRKTTRCTVEASYGLPFTASSARTGKRCVAGWATWSSHQTPWGST
ncbi:hypothetical protein [Reticulibacter mediterranei]|uniref:hypothetical protein n=1 Tax=Reticulibacter mediterranei TaxID=2778369 RepID=UPI001C68DB6D|nr:hypothetical protein [Reticulibacter mediterranei]